MQHSIVDYLRAYAGAHDRGVLDDQLRHAGYDEASIATAWRIVGTQPAWPAPTTPNGGHHGYATMHHDGLMPSPFPAWAIVLITLLVTTALGVGAVHLLGELPIGSTSKLHDESSASVGADQGLHDTDAGALGRPVVGTTVEGQLPRGWKAQKATKFTNGWIHAETGASVNVSTLPGGRGDYDIEAELTKTAGSMSEDLGFPITGFDQIEKTTFDERSAFSRAGYGKIAGDELHVTQWWIPIENDLVVVTASGRAPLDASESTELRQVVKSLRLQSA